jgi:outer membrane lipoprotein-sorting protein
MNRRSMGVVVLAVFALAGVGAGAQQSVDDIISKNLQAKGGLEKMRAVQTLKQTSHLTITTPGGAFEATLVMYGKRPNMTRQEMSMAGQMTVSAFDGQVAWQVSPMMGILTPTPMVGPQADALKEQSDFDGPLVDYKTKGFTIELVGTEPVGDRKAYHLKMTGKDQRVQHCYLDVETSLEMKTVSDSPSGPIEQQLADYRDVEGMKLPFMIRSLMGGNELAKIQVEKVEINVKFDDGIFKMPKGH